MTHAARTTDQQGFSILEALVAIALIAGAFLPLLVLQGQLTRSAIAVERAEQSLQARNNAIAYLRTLNPTLRPVGEEDLGVATMAWTSTLIQPARTARSMTGETGRFDVSLYEVNVQLTFATGRVDSFSVRQVGWIATRPVGDIG